MKNILKIDYSTYIIIILYLLSGNFKEIIILYLIIFIHELGHLFFLKKYHKKIENIIFYPFGGITKYQSFVNHNLKEELLISCGGIINQILLFIIFFGLFKLTLINQYTYNIFSKNNIALLIFNLLPIIGLDGEKILRIILENFISYVKVNTLIIIISFITLVLFIIKSISLKFNIIFILSFLIYKIIYFIRNRKYLENKFLLERYLYDLKYSKIKYLNNNDLKNMYQDTYHFFNYVNECTVLNKKYRNEYQNMIYLNRKVR